MAIKLSILVVVLLANSARAVFIANVASFTSQAASQAAVEAMEMVFARSDKAHAASMDLIMKSMSMEKAWHLLAKHNLTSPALLEVKSNMSEKQSNLRKGTPQKGYSGVEGARKLLNSMIYDSQLEYDKKILECVDYYASHCAQMELARGEIAAANYIAASSRALILDSQDTINKCEVDIPTTNQALDEHNFNCKTDIAALRSEVKVVEADIAVVTSILKLTDCGKKSFVQGNSLRMLRCEDECTKESSITFDNNEIHQAVSHLQSSVAKKFMHDTFANLFQGIQSLEAVEFLQIDQKNLTINTTKFNNPPVPRTDIPADPCKDPFAGAPNTRKKRSKKCALGAPNCYKLQERFLLIQSGIADTRNALLEDLADMENHCRDTRATLQKQIKSDESMLAAAQTKLGLATEKEADAGEKARTTAQRNNELDIQLKGKMGKCSASYASIESELCALKKIRGELYKMQKTGYSARAFVDCDVTKWEPEECSTQCKRRGEKDGQQKLIRSILTHPDGGSKCLPLSAIRKCGLKPCPINCKVSDWSGWSKCSAECGGGLQQRLKTVHRAAKFDGNECGEISDSVACNVQACEADCDLSSWSRWSWCSKDCDGGTRKRTKHITEAPKGDGECPIANSTRRLQYKACNKFPCLSLQAGDCSTYIRDINMYTCDTLPTCCGGYVGMGLSDKTVQCLPIGWSGDASYKAKCGPRSQVKKCRKELDIVLLIDGSGSLGKRGWDAEIKAATLFVDAFTVPKNTVTNKHSAQIATILYSGPRTWNAYYRCSGRSAGKVDQEKDCRIKTVNHFLTDMKKVRENIAALTWPRGSTFTSGAIMRAQAELSLGRKDAKSVIVLITDGRPISYWSTYQASRKVRRMSRLVWVAVTRYAPLRYIKMWATQRWEENVVRVKEFKELDKPNIVNQIIADICPPSYTPFGGGFGELM